MSLEQTGSGYDDVIYIDPLPPNDDNRRRIVPAEPFSDFLLNLVLKRYGIYVIDGETADARPRFPILVLTHGKLRLETNNCFQLPAQELGDEYSLEIYHAVEEEEGARWYSEYIATSTTSIRREQMVESIFSTPVRLRFRLVRFVQVNTRTETIAEVIIEW